MGNAFGTEWPEYRLLTDAEEAVRTHNDRMFEARLIANGGDAVAVRHEWLEQLRTEVIEESCGRWGVNGIAVARRNHGDAWEVITIYGSLLFTQFLK